MYVEFSPSAGGADHEPRPGGHQWRALWIPSGAVHSHRAYGVTRLHFLGLTQNPLKLHEPTALAVSPLLRELLITYTELDDRETPAGKRMRSVLLDQLATASERPVRVPTAHDPVSRRSARRSRPTPRTHAVSKRSAVPPEQAGGR